MATTVTLTFSDPDLPRCVNAATNRNQIQAGPLPPQYPPTGSTSAAILKAWLIALAQEATLLREGYQGNFVGNTPPTIT